MPHVIKPTPGQMVCFILVSTMPGFAGNALQALGATIAQVNDDRNVNLCVFDANGVPHPMQNVPLVQDGDTTPSGNFCVFPTPDPAADLAPEDRAAMEAVGQESAADLSQPVPAESAPSAAE